MQGTMHDIVLWLALKPCSAPSHVPKTGNQPISTGQLPIGSRKQRRKERRGIKFTRCAGSATRRSRWGSYPDYGVAPNLHVLRCMKYGPGCPGHAWPCGCERFRMRGMHLWLSSVLRNKVKFAKP